MLQIVVPMAGLGSRFADAGYEDPKPLIPIHGMPMIQVVSENVRPEREHRFIYICQAEVARRYDLQDRLGHISPGCVVVEIDGLTQGAACTVLLAAEYFGDDPIMVVNSDQFVTTRIDHYLATSDTPDLDGLIMTMELRGDPKWSYVELDDRERAVRVVEKEPISEHATVGIYNFARGSEFVAAAERMIELDERVNGEFYLAPVYNQMIAKGAAIGVHSVGPEATGMYGLGVPVDLERFLALPISHAAVEEYTKRG
jgi:dTDP-glucose pyrophosphorylase